LRPVPVPITPEARPDPDTVTPEVRPDPDTPTPELRPDPDTVTPGLRPDPDTVTPGLRPDPDTVTPGLRPDPDTVTPGLRPVPDTVTPGLRPDPDTVTPGLRPDPDTVTPGLRPDPDVGGPTVRPIQRPRPETLPPIARTGVAPGRDERRPMLMTADEVCRAGREGRLRGDPQLVEKACRIAANARRRWTAWGEWNYSTLKDDRSGARTKGSANQYNIGLDRWIDKRTVAGLAIQFGNSDYKSFNGGMRQQADSITVKPYMVHRMADSDVVLDASIGFNFGEYEQHVLMLSGKHDSFTLSGTIGMSAQRPLGSFLLRPRLSWSYASIWHDNYVLQGQVGGIDLRVLQGDARYDYGAVATSLEISRPFRSDDMVITPYVEGGVDFAYLRPNGGRILGPDLRLIATTPAVGSVRFGTRIQLRGNVALIGSGEYYGIGSGGLSSWQWRGNLSFRF
jgi:Autotransporter beta-domain